MQTEDFGRVAVLYGGLNAERDVSLNSGKAVLDALLSKGVDAYGIDVGHDIVHVLQQGNYDRVFNVLHGRGGEDGGMQAVLDFLEIPYCGSGVAASALAMDKLRAKWIWKASDLPTPEFMLIKNENDLKTAAEKIGFPLCVKPIHEGSSCGVVKVKSESELLPALKEAKKCNDDIMACRWIEGDEYTVGIVGNELFPSVKISTPREFYDYEAKYLVDTTVYECPSDLAPEDECCLQSMAKQAYDLLGCEGLGRVDFMQDADGAFWLIEVNTIPGMTATSLLPKAAKAKGIDFSDLVVSILETSFSRARENEKLA